MDTHRIASILPQHCRGNRNIYYINIGHEVVEILWEERYHIVFPRWFGSRKFSSTALFPLLSVIDSSSLACCTSSVIFRVSFYFFSIPLRASVEYRADEAMMRDSSSRTKPSATLLALAPMLRIIILLLGLSTISTAQKQCMYFIFVFTLWLARVVLSRRLLLILGSVLTRSGSITYTPRHHPRPFRANTVR